MDRSKHFDLNGGDQEVRENVDNDERYKSASIIRKLYITGAADKVASLMG